MRRIKRHSPRSSDAPAAFVTVPGQLGNYVAKFEAMLNAGEVPTEGVWVAKIEHDDWCAIFLSGHCDCDPSIRFIKPPQHETKGDA